MKGGPSRKKERALELAQEKERKKVADTEAKQEHMEYKRRLAQVKRPTKAGMTISNAICVSNGGEAGRK